MGTLIDGMAITEAVLLSFLFALWISWLGLRGLFRAMPAGHCHAAPAQVMTTRPADESRRTLGVTRTALNGAR